MFPIYKYQILSFTEAREETVSKKSEIECAFLWL